MPSTLTHRPVIGRRTTAHPTAAEAVDHLRRARACLERLALDGPSPDRVADFPHLEDATRSIHGALTALDACTWERQRRY